MVKSSHLQESENCILRQPGKMTKTNSTPAWPQPSHSIQFHPQYTGSFNPTGLNLQRASLQAITELSFILKAEILVAKFQSVSESYFLLPCRLQIHSKAASQKHWCTHHYRQSKYWILLKVFVQLLWKDRQHWPWDPGGELFNSLSSGDLLIVLKASGPVSSLWVSE